MPLSSPGVTPRTVEALSNEPDGRGEGGEGKEDEEDTTGRHILPPNCLAIWMSDCWKGRFIGAGACDLRPRLHLGASRQGASYLRLNCMARIRRFMTMITNCFTGVYIV